MLLDLRFALRSLLKTPGFTGIVILTLALGIGASTTIFGIVNTTFLRALPYPDAERLVALDERAPDGDSMSISYPDFLDWTERQDVFSGLALHHTHQGKLRTDRGSEQVTALMVTRDFFSLLGLQPVLGRALTAADDQPGATPSAWLTYPAWQQHYGAAPGIVGRTLLFAGRSVVVAGVLPPEYRFERSAELILPVAPFAESLFLNSRENHNDCRALARLKPGVTLEAARTRMEAIARVIAQENPKVNTGIGTSVRPLREHLAGWARGQQLMLVSAVVLVLLIACVNVANMLLARGLARAREMALRTALGASRSRLVRQLLTESLLLSSAGAGLGALFAVWGYDFARRLVPGSVQAVVDASQGFDARVLLFTVLAALLTGIGFGLAPAWQCSHIRPNEALKDTPRTVHTLFGRVRLGDLLVVTQVALALMLLIGAGLLIRSLARLNRVDPGFRPERILTLRVSAVPMDQFRNDPFSVIARNERILDTLRTLPEVEAAAFGSAVPFTWSISSMVFHRADRPVPAPGEYPQANSHWVSADYFRTMGIPLVRGRLFDGHEPQPALPPGTVIAPENLGRLFEGIDLACVISRRMAEKFWPGEDPLGKRFRLGYAKMQFPFAVVVGIVGDTQQVGLDQAAPPEFYLTMRQFPDPFGDMLVVRTRTDPAALAATLRTTLQRALTDEPVFDLQPMSARIADSVSSRQFNMGLFAFFAGAALLIALIGIYGVLTFNVQLRTREMGVRMALGATRRDILLGVMRRGLGLVLAGLALGLAGAWIGSRLLRGQLYEVAGTDLPTYLAAALLLLGAALLASFLPARRATKIDPLVALRTE